MSHHAMLSKYGNSKCLLKIKNKLKSVVLQIQSGKILNILWAFSIKLFHSHLLEMIIANSVLHTSLAIYHLISRVRTHLERPWRSSDFEIKIQGLESSWKLQSVVESPWISGLTFQTQILNCINLRSGVIFFASLLPWLEREKNNAWYIYLTSHQPPPNLHNLTSAWPVMLLANQRLPEGNKILAGIIMSLSIGNKV